MTKKQKSPATVLTDAEEQYKKNEEVIVRKVQSLYKQAIADLAALAVKMDGIPESQSFSFKYNQQIAQKVEETIRNLAQRIEGVVMHGSHREWLAACAKSDAFIGSIMNTSNLTKQTLQKYQARNLEALAAFQERKVNGLNLSERIWKYIAPLKDEVELVTDTTKKYYKHGINSSKSLTKMDRAIGTGMSAQQLSREIRSCLKEPNKLFRRVRDKYGNLHLSKAASLYHPGQGVYRSSYKNAMRMTRSEVNMAYRQSDYLRWQQLDFVVGLRIGLSGNHTCLGEDGKSHPFYDICDVLAGDYPKDFKFVGWHPQCRCHVTPILKPYDEWHEDRKYIDSKAYRQMPASNQVNRPTKAFCDYIKTNKGRIEGWSSTPYYIKDNSQYVAYAVDPKTFPINILDLDDANTYKQLADLRMYAFNHQGSGKFNKALDDALKAQMAGDKDALESAMKEMEAIKRKNDASTVSKAKMKEKKLKDPAVMRHQYDARIEELRKNAERYKLDLTKVDEAYTSLSMAKIDVAVKEQEALLEAGKARMGKIYAAADKRHAEMASRLEQMGLTRKEYAEKILAERRARFENIQKKSAALIPQASQYSKDINLTRLEDLQTRKQYNQMAKENEAIEAKIAEIKAMDVEMADLIPDVASLHDTYSVEYIKNAYNEIESKFKVVGPMSLKDQEVILQNYLKASGNNIAKKAFETRLKTVQTDIKIGELTPVVNDIVSASAKTSVSGYQSLATEAQNALLSRDVVLAESLLKQAQTMRSVVDQYEALLATGYKTGKFNKAMEDCLVALNKGDVAQALIHVQDAAQVKAYNEARDARRKAKKAEEEARKKAEEEAKAKKKKVVNKDTENIDDIREALGVRTPVLLKHYEDSVTRTQYTNAKYLAEEKEFHDKMKAMFDDSNFSHCFMPQYLKGYLEKGILTNLQTGEGDYDSRRAYGHFAYGFQEDKSPVPRSKWLKDGDYYRCGVPVNKDPTIAYNQLSGYGECQLVLRKEKVVTTFTFDNSLNQNTIPSLTCDPKTCSLDRKTMRRFNDEKYDSRTAAAGSSSNYIEIQYLPMGDTQYIGPECFASITLPQHPVGYYGHDKLFWQKWAAKGVDVMYYNSKTGKVELFMKGKGAIPAKYDETPEQRKARQVKAANRAAERHRIRNMVIKITGKTPETKIQALLAQRAKENSEALSYAMNIVNQQFELINADFDKSNFELLMDKVIASNARSAKAEAQRIEKILAEQKAELGKLEDLIPDYEKWHKDFTIDELKRAHAEIKKQIEWMETRYPNRDDYNEVIGKWGRIANYVENPDYGTRSKTWEVAKTAYLRKRDELIYQYRGASIEDNIIRLNGFKTEDTQFDAMIKSIRNNAKKGRWADVEDMIEKAKQRMLELSTPSGGHVLKFGESSHIVFAKEDFEQARKDAANWFRCGPKETTIQIQKAFKEADAYMSQYAEEMWKNLTLEEKHILWLYTDGSQYINKEMLGAYSLRMKSWIDKSMRNGLADANVLTSILEKAPALRDDIWMQSGKSVDAFRVMFGVNIDRADLTKLVDKEGTSDLFMSCHAARDGAFAKGVSTGDGANRVVLSIFMPKGTKGAYMEPFASYGDSKRGEEGFKWNGKRRKEAPSDQVEFLLQRGAKFKITKAVYDPDKDKWYVDVDLIEQKAVGVLDTKISDLDRRPIRFKAPTT